MLVWQHPVSLTICEDTQLTAGDVRKLLPILQVLRKVMGSFFLPSTAIFHWLEDHAQIRLSILLTYLFGESILFVHLLTWLDRAWNVAGYASPPPPPPPTHTSSLPLSLS